MHRVAVILPAAGQSRRFGGGQKKVYLDLAGRPVIVRSIEAFAQRPDVAQIVIVVSEDAIADCWHLLRGFSFGCVIDVVAGGAERADSVLNGLQAVRAGIAFVAVHDAARPLVTQAAISAVFADAAAFGSALLADPVTATLKQVNQDRVVTATVPRAGMWHAQTPQVFRTTILQAAYERRQPGEATDEAQLVEAAGFPVHITAGSPLNLKLTTRDDLLLAEALLPLVQAADRFSSL